MTTERSIVFDMWSSRRGQRVRPLLFRSGVPFGLTYLNYSYIGIYIHSNERILRKCSEPVIMPPSLSHKCISGRQLIRRQWMRTADATRCLSVVSVRGNARSENRKTSFIGCSHNRANIEQTSSWLKQTYWNPAPGSNVGLGLGF